MTLLVAVFIHKMLENISPVSRRSLVGICYLCEELSDAWQ